MMMKNVIPEQRKCNRCQMIHPAPYDNACPVFVNKSVNMKPIAEFNEWIMTNLPKYKNFEALIPAIKKLIELKGEK